jgi:putative transposase
MIFLTPTVRTDYYSCMGRSPRITQPGFAYHILNRRVMRLPLFKKDGDYHAFERVLAESLARTGAPELMAWCLMPNHWHLVVRATSQTDLSTWMQWVTVTHVHRWHAHTKTAGEGPLYQGRFRSFPVQEDYHFLRVCRYVEANALRATLVDRAEDWRWGSLQMRRGGESPLRQWLRPWPVNQPRNWLADVNRAMEDAALKQLRHSVKVGTPFGHETWSTRVARRLGLQSSLRPRGRPRKDANKSS